ncbi:putative ABC transporter ATP-binding protein YbhF [Hartmannibacter diazotrophicus]|uniref:Putative ABC transporter ATP-binding protein YbhF n=1 Tax=Hartmannibacter diazotrophicus TaxID=1482074 RepID=A0A2C9DCJ4_9HYPH|nr:ribosome-associated ATPase/putative transporter RbbA [Hartmannibacter diazotrophicus]SON57451.1 putative ABC transporter ATP-binding protein YbhF [Hartmannibacter diazotrophicus]
MPPGEPAVRVVSVTHRYGRTTAADDVSFDLPSGSATAVIGPDGVGKSAILGLIAGVRRLQTGTVEVLGGSMADAGHRSRIAGRIAYMPQGLGRNLYPTLSVTENVDFHARLFGLHGRERAARIARLLQATGLDPFPDRPAGKLSGGMKQKLSLCCALVHDPDLLILDEPTTGVDPLSRRQFWSLIDRIRADRPGMTVIVATAYMEEAERFDRVIAVDDGRLIACGPTAEVIANAGGKGLEAAYRRLQNSGNDPGEDILVIPPRTDADGGAPVIVAEGLTRRFGNFTAVDHVSFSIPRGEIFGFLGSNGCGKTTTMKMLTGLLDATEGRAELFGRSVDPRDLTARLDVGYMSQSFSLYEELTVRGNLRLHARLYRVPSGEIADRVNESLDRFGLREVADDLPAKLPLGLRQRLQLAAACLHRPRMLILDEPTSGVDPAARDHFWRHLADLSRKDGVTIFVSTHFMNEAERCDRISLMHRGRVLAMGTPADLVASRHAPSLEEAFISYLVEDDEEGTVEPDVAADGTDQPAATHDAPSGVASSLGRVWAFCRREALEILRDRIRIGFAVGIPVFLLFIFSFGISFDVESLPYAVFDRDQSAESRGFLRSFEGSRYFEQHDPIGSEAEVDWRLQDGELRLVIGIPPSFGRDLLLSRQPEVSVWIDGANTFRAETVRSYVNGLVTTWAEEKAREASAGASGLVLPIEIRPRFLYNQAFKSVNAIAPGVIMLVLMLIPSMMTALGVVREREIGSIANLQASPASVVEFLIGKQLAYVALATVNIAMLIATAVFVFGVPFNGSLTAMTFGALLYVFACTAFGLLVSTIVTTQVAATFATAILSVIPAINFSGFLFPLASVEGPGRVVGTLFPASWFQTISLGTFAKIRPVTDFAANFAMLALFGLIFIGAASLILKKQEP